MTQPVQKNPTEEQIQDRAFELYLQRGGQHGGDLADWLEAEKQLIGALVPTSDTASGKKFIEKKKPLARGAAASAAEGT